MNVIIFCKNFETLKVINNVILSEITCINKLLVFSEQSISNAIEARNRLLPKLMNGEIEVWYMEYTSFHEFSKKYW